MPWFFCCSVGVLFVLFFKICYVQRVLRKEAVAIDLS